LNLRVIGGLIIVTADRRRRIPRCQPWFTFGCPQASGDAAASNQATGLLPRTRRRCPGGDPPSVIDMMLTTFHAQMTGR